MTECPTIVLGVDGSDESRSAIEWALGQAKQMGARVRVVSAYSFPSYSPATESSLVNVDDGYIRQRGLEAAQAVCDEAEKLGVSAQPQVVPGDPASILIEESKQADMLVIGTAGNQGIADRLLGTVSASVPAKAHCPVVVVPEHQEGSPFIPVNRLVVGVDGSDSASTALRRAVDLAHMWDAKLAAVSAVPFATGNTLMAWIPPIIDRERVTQDIRVGLDVAVNEVLDGRAVTVARHVLDGNPTELLTEFSTAVDLIVVGRRGRGGFTGLLLGSTSQELLARSTCPVMVVPHPKRDRKEPTQPVQKQWKRA